MRLISPNAKATSGAPVMEAKHRVDSIITGSSLAVKNRLMSCPRIFWVGPGRRMLQGSRTARRIVERGHRPVRFRRRRAFSLSATSIFLASGHPPLDPSLRFTAVSIPSWERDLGSLWHCWDYSCGM